MHVNLIPTAVTLQKYYEGFGFSKPSKYRLQRLLVEKTMRSKARHILDRLGVHKEDRILDYGGGTGAFARGFKSCGMQVELHDLDCSFFEELRLLRIPCHEQVPENKFDTVFSSHVIEHRLDPNIFFTDLFRLTKPGVLP